MFVGYNIFLLRQTIKEEILPKPIQTKKYRYRLYLMPGNTDTYRKNDWYHRGMQLYMQHPKRACRGLVGDSKQEDIYRKYRGIRNTGG